MLNEPPSLTFLELLGTYGIYPILSMIWFPIILISMALYLEYKIRTKGE